MTNRIAPQESQVTEYGLLIRTRCPMNEITDEMVAAMARYANLPPQTCRIVVQVTDHHHTELWHEAEYRMIARRDTKRTDEVDGGRQTITRDVVQMQVERIGAWWTSRLAPGAIVTEADPDPVPAKRGPGRPPKAEAA